MKEPRGLLHPGWALELPLFPPTSAGETADTEITSGRRSGALAQLLGRQSSE